MDCPVCKSAVEDSTLICPNCHQHIAKMEQTKKLEIAKNGLKQNVADIFSSKSFLNLCIVMSVITLIFFLNIILCLTDMSSPLDLIGLILFPGFLIPTIITTVFSWKFFTNRKTVAIEKIKGLKAFPAFFRVILLIFSIVAAIIIGIILVFTIITIVETLESPSASNGLWGILEAFGLEGMLFGYGVTPLIIFTVLFFLFAVLFLYCIVRAANTFLLIEFIYQEFSTIYNKGEFEHIYTSENEENIALPVVSLYVLSGIITSLAIYSMIFASLTLSFIMIAIALYLVFIAIFFKEAEKHLRIGKEKCDVESEKLAVITEETEKEQAILDKKLREERRAELKREAEEEKRKQAELAEREAIYQQLLLKETMRTILAEEKNPKKGENV